MAISGTRSDGDEITFKDAKIEIDLTPASSSYAEISTWANNVVVSGGEVPVDEMKTYQGNPIISPGERGKVRVEITCVATEGATDPHAQIYDAWDADPGLLTDTRWSPKGGATGDFLWTTVNGRLVYVSVPQEPAERGGPASFMYAIECSKIARSAVSP